MGWYAKSRTRAYGRLEGKRGKTWEGGRDLDGIEPVEYCDSLFLEACDIGRGSVDLREGGEVINGGSGGWFALDDGEVTAGGEVAGDELGDITAVILERW